jgi:hypothetical protein
MFRLRTGMLLSLSIFATTSALAQVSYPFDWHTEQNIDTHQVGRVEIRIDREGHGSVRHFWSMEA